MTQPSTSAAASAVPRGSDRFLTVQVPDLKAAGIPTVVFTTTRFEQLTRTVAGTLGLPDARIVVVPHPLGGTDPATVSAWADDAVEATLVALGAG